MYWSSSCKTWPTTKTDILMLYNYYLAGTGNISRHHYIWINCIFFVIMVFPEVNYHCTDLPSRLNGYSHRKPVASPNQNELKKVPGSCVAVYVYARFWFFMDWLNARIIPSADPFRMKTTENFAAFGSKHRKFFEVNFPML